MSRAYARTAREGDTLGHHERWRPKEAGEQVSGRRKGSQEELGTQLRGVIEQALDALELELDALDVVRMGNRKVVKVVVDAERGVELDEVAGASREVSRALDDADDAIAGSYTLEVTSPGLDRPLTLPRHWRRAYGRLVTLTKEDGSTHTARVGRADEQGVELLFGQSLHRIAYTEIRRAVVEVEFNPPGERELASLEQDESHRPDRGSPGPNTKEDPR
jgi:ribosome maturation factor RimP